MNSIGFIGLGNMAGAIIKGLRASTDFANTVIIGFDHNQSKLEHFATKYQVQGKADASHVAAGCDILVLAIKPQGLDDLLPQIKGSIHPGQLLISLAAGRSLGFYAGFLSNQVPLVQAMPNINAKVGLSATALCANDAVSDQQLEQAKQLFSAIGSVTVLPESKLPAFSAIAGAGPAFAYLFIDALASAGIQAGLTRSQAQEAACAMLLGSTRLVMDTGEHPMALVDQVTSPGGTTIQGIHQLKKLGFEHAVHQAVLAVIEKNERLKQG